SADDGTAPAAAAGRGSFVRRERARCARAARREAHGAVAHLPRLRDARDERARVPGLATRAPLAGGHAGGDAHDADRGPAGGELLSLRGVCVPDQAGTTPRDAGDAARPRTA